VRPLCVVGTQRDVGKTTFCLGLIGALRKRGLSVGYTKPLGQRVKTVDGHSVHDDALVISRAMDLDASSAVMAVPLTRGRVEKEIYNLNSPELADKVTEVCRRLREENDLVLVEGMGHVAMGACLQLSAADVARLIGAGCVLVSGGGIGRAIDQIVLCETFLTARGADMMGAVVNKVWAQKYDRVREATTAGLENLGIRSFGTVPYEDTLSAPTVGQVARELGGEVLAGSDALDNRVGRAIVAAMEPQHMVLYLKDRALVIIPGDRGDNILAILSTYMLAKGSGLPVSGVVLTGGFRPAGKVMTLLAESGLPAILCREDTCTIAARLREKIFKITPDDRERIETAMRLVDEYVDVDAILEGLKE